MSKFFERHVRPSFAYGVAIVLTGTVVLAFRYWPPGEPLALPMLVLLIAVIGSGILGGPGPAILAAGLAAVAGAVLFIPPAGLLKVRSDAPRGHAGDPARPARSQGRWPLRPRHSHGSARPAG